MLVIQMCTSVSSTCSLGMAGLSSVNDANKARSFIRFNAVARSCAGSVVGATPQGALRLDRRGRVVDPPLHERRQELAYLWVGGPGGVGGAGHALVLNERLEEHVDAGTPRVVAIGGNSVVEAFQRRIGRHNDLLEQRQQHRILRREIEVERRPGQPGTPGQVIDGDIGERPLVHQSLGRREDRQFAIIARWARRPPSARGPGLTRCRHSGLLYCVSNFSTHC